MPIKHSFFLFFLIISFHLQAQNSVTVKKEAIALIGLVNKFHIAPKPVDDSLSSYIYSNLLADLNPDGVLLTQAEIENLSYFDLLLDDELNGSDWNFLAAVDLTFRNAMQRLVKLIEKIAEKPFDYGKKEIFIPNGSAKFTPIATEKELEERVRLWLKFLVLNDLAETAIEDKNYDLKDILKSEPVVRKKIADQEIEYLNDFLADTKMEFISAFYLNHLSTYFDPHTMYFSANEKEAFEDELTSEDFRFGITLSTNEDGQVIIDKLEPGGAAWKSNKLNNGDCLLKLKWENEDETDVSEMSITEIHKILQRDDATVLTFTVKKANGSKKSVKLKKEIVTETEDIVKSYILSGEKKIGYITLPDFYTGWQGDGKKGCANDVAKEILKLQKENIEGLILDVRNNGGGSLPEAMDLAGIFINEGPLSVISMRDIKPQTIKDENRGTIFNGPLVLMINAQSASASEVLAASLQDYNRALIVGQDSYGKATGQIIFPNDTSTSYEKVNRRDFENNTSFVKLTISKLYRITCKTAQKNGIHPDIELPDLYKGLYQKEKDYETVLSSDSIAKKTYYTPLQKFPIEQLSAKSAERLQSDSVLLKSVLVRDSILAYIENNENGILLNLESYLAQQKEIIRLVDYLSLGKPDINHIYTVDNNAYEDKVISLDDYRKELNSEVRSELKGDPLLMETYRIMTDLIIFTKK